MQQAYILPHVIGRLETIRERKYSLEHSPFIGYYASKNDGR